MKIGNVEVNTRLALGPMAGVSDLAFRQVCRERSGCYTVSEMVSAKALCYGDKKTPALLKLGEGEHPAAVQIFGCDEPFMEKGAALFRCHIRGWARPSCASGRWPAGWPPPWSGGRG